MSKRPGRGDFVPLKRIVTEVMKSLKARDSEQTKEVERIWRELVGEELARFSRIRGVAANTVDVEVDGSAVLAEVDQFFRGAFLEKLKAEGVSGMDSVAFHLSDR